MKTLVKAGKEVTEVFYNMNQSVRSGSLKFIDACREEKLFPICELSEEAMNKASYRKKSDGVLGVLKTWDMGLESLRSEELGQVIIILDEIEKPGNLGAIIRSAEALGAHAIILSDPQVDLFNPNVIRSSKGLLGRMTIKSGKKEEVWKVINQLGFKPLATSAKAMNLSHEYPYAPKMALVFGSEQKGLGNFWKENVNEWVKLQMLGSANSLNLNASLACVLNDYSETQRRI